MTIAQLIPLAVQVSMALILVSVALTARPRDTVQLVRRPALLVRAVLAMNVIMPLFAITLALAFDLNHFVEIALIALALAPVPPLLPNKELKAGGNPSSVIGLFAVAGSLSIVFVPAAVAILGRVFDRPVHVSTGAVAWIVLTSMLLPLAVGISIRLAAPPLADKMAKPASVCGTVLLVIAFVPVLIAQWPAIVALIGNFTLVAIVAFTLFGLAVGHVLGGPDPEDRTMLALCTATRHPAVAMAIIHDTGDRHAALAAVLLTLLVGAIISLPYVKWRGRAEARLHPPKLS